MITILQKSRVNNGRLGAKVNKCVITVVLVGGLFDQSS